MRTAGRTWSQSARRYSGFGRSWGAATRVAKTSTPGGAIIRNSGSTVMSESSTIARIRPRSLYMPCPLAGSGRVDARILALHPSAPPALGPGPGRDPGTAQRARPAAGARIRSETSERLDPRDSVPTRSAVPASTGGASSARTCPSARGPSADSRDHREGLPPPPPARLCGCGSTTTARFLSGKPRSSPNRPPARGRPRPPRTRPSPGWREVLEHAVVQRLRVDAARVEGEGDPTGTLYDALSGEADAGRPPLPPA